MSFVNVGSKQGDTFVLGVYHTGENTVDVSLQNPLFAGDSSDWMMGVEALNVPLDGTRFLDKNHPTLFRLRRVQHGKPIEPENVIFYENGGLVSEFDDVGAELQEWTEGTTQLDHTATPARELGDFFDQLVAWGSRINDLINRVGLDRDDLPNAHGPDVPQNIFNGRWDARTMNALPQEQKEFRHLKIRTTPSGLISISGTRMFWSNFFITTSSYARALTGLPSMIAFDPATGDPIDDFPVQGPLELVDFPNNYEDPTNARAYDEFTAMGDTSLWGSTDTRLSISVATDLPTRRSLTITDDRQCRDFSIASFDLCNELKITTEVTDQLTSVYTIESEGRSGHIALKKSGPPNYWTMMAPSTNLRHLRLRLMMRERVWDERSGQWRIVNRDLPVAPHQTWHCNLLFARRTH